MSFGSASSLERYFYRSSPGGGGLAGCFEAAFLITLFFPISCEAPFMQAGVL